jgi:hypothetical protein
MFYLFTEIYWSLDEVILEQYWRVFTVVLKETPIVIISPMCFHLHLCENDNWDSSSEKHLRNPKTSRAS